MLFKKSAIIGYSGFVGENITKQITFDDYYSSANIKDIKGKSYDTILSCATKSERWKANTDEKGDWKAINKLLTNLLSVKAKHFILISTVDVYPNPSNANEDTKISQNLLTQPYGKNRFKMELFVKKHFKNYTIIRMPQLYGIHLKKNFIYDLIYKNALDFTHKDSMLQFYNLNNFSKDLKKVLKNNIKIVNFSVEPISAGEIAKTCAGMKFNTQTEKPPLIFDVKSKYAKLLGSKENYFYSKQKTLKEITSFIKIQKSKSKIAISNLSWEKTQDNLVSKILATHNISNIEIAPTKIWTNPTDISPKNIISYKNYWLNKNIDIVSVTSILYGHPELQLFESEKNTLETLKYLKKIISIASLLGAKVILFGSPKNRSYKNISYKEAFRRATDFFKKVATYCEKYHITLVLEANPKIYGTNFINSTSQAIDLVKAVNHPNFRLHLDLSTMIINKENLEKTIKRSILHASHFHISEPSLKEIPQNINYHKNISFLLKKYDYKYYKTIEMPLGSKGNITKIKRAVKFVNKIYI